jgi:ABC-type sugar transport system permease subunit
MPSRQFKHQCERYLMPVRLRKFIGTILIVVLVLAYAVLANTIAVATLGNAPWWGQLLYFFLTGLLWVLPAMVIIKWMAGPKQQ